MPWAIASFSRNKISYIQTRIFVTNGLSYLKDVDRIVVLKGGTISEIGSYRELIASRGAFADFLETYLKENISEDHTKMGEEGMYNLSLSFCLNFISYLFRLSAEITFVFLPIIE